MPNYEQIARQIAIKQGIDPNYFTSQIRAESNFDPNARSGAGAIGIAQIVPKWHPGVDPTNPLASLNYAAKWDADLLSKYGGDWRQVLSTYNSGAPNRWNDPSFAQGQTYNYVRKILGETYKPGAAGTGVAVTQPTPARTASSLPTSLPATAMPSSMPMKLPSPSEMGYALPPLSVLRKGGTALTNALLRSSDKAISYVPPKTIPTKAGVALPVPTILQPPANSKTPSGVPPTTGTSSVVNAALKWMGTDYSWGGGGPAGPSYGIEQGANIKGFDCSGLLQYAYAKAGLSIGGTTYEQWPTGQHVSRQALRPGDAVFFHMADGYPQHVGIYMGSDKFIEAPHTGAQVRISDMSTRDDFVGGRRWG